MKKILFILAVTTWCLGGSALSIQAQTHSVRQASTSAAKAPKAADKAVAVKAAQEKSTFSTFRLVINKGEIFSVNAPGELTEIALSDYLVVPNENTNNSQTGEINEFSCVNKTTLYGRTLINDYSVTPSSQVTASVQMPAIIAKQGLLLSLVIDGKTLSVRLPYITSDYCWQSGAGYLYTITINGNEPQITGVTVLPE